jgi:hypothetical protein
MRAQGLTVGSEVSEAKCPLMNSYDLIGSKISVRNREGAEDAESGGANLVLIRAPVRCNQNAPVSTAV